jgi:hypothetical protein
MTGQEAKALYKLAQSGAGMPFGEVYAPIQAPPSGGIASLLQFPLTALAIQRTPGLGQLTRAPTALTLRHYIDMARKAGFNPLESGTSTSLRNILSRKGLRDISKQFENWAKVMAEKHPEKTIFKTWSRMKPQRAITGKMMPRLHKATTYRGAGIPYVLAEPLITTFNYLKNKPKIMDQARQMGSKIRNPFLRAKGD